MTDTQTLQVESLPTDVLQKKLQQLKHVISTQSKQNFELERDVRYLDARIALLVKNYSISQLTNGKKSAQDEEEENEVWNIIDSHSAGNKSTEGEVRLPDKLAQLYSQLFYILQTEPLHLSKLLNRVTLAEVDTLMQVIMFSLFGSQYDIREECLLLSVFQVSRISLWLYHSPC